MIRVRYRARHPPKPPRGPSVARLAIEWGNARRFISLAHHQRTGTVRSSFYKRKAATAIDVLIEEGIEEPVAEGVTTRIRASFRQLLEQWRSRRRSGAPSSQQQSAVSQQSREDYLLLVGDVAFVAAGELEESRVESTDGEEGGAHEADAGHVLEGTVVERTELWWAIQVTKAFERSKVHRSCVIKCFWLDAMGEQKYKVLSDREVSVFRGTLLLNPGTTRQIVVHGDDLTASWEGDSLQAVYQFSHELCGQLDDAAELQLRDDHDVVESEVESEGLGEEDEQEAEDTDIEQPVHDERRARLERRAVGKEAKAASLRQQNLQEVLVHREAERPDRVPNHRPRTERPVTRASAWERARDVAGNF